jgi:glucoamylase
MSIAPLQIAPGAPGGPSRWTHSTKEGLGTAYHTGCHLWFTLSHGIVDEIYYPTIDQPNTRDFQLLITDGESFCHEEKRHLIHRIEYPEKDSLYYRLTNSDPDGRYRIVKHVLTGPHRSVLLMQVRLEVLDETLRGKLRVYARLAPHLARRGADNSAWVCEFAGRRMFHVAREDVHLSLGCAPDFTKRSVGFVGASDGWQDLMENFRMDWEFRAAEGGNLALTAELDPSVDQWTLGVAFGRSAQSSATKLLQCSAESWEEHRDAYVRQWRRATARDEDDLAPHTTDGGSMARLSRCILLAHEDKLFQGALIASLSIPWGETRGDDEIGGYHLVWTRDLVQSATALLASGQRHTPLRALIWLGCIQQKDGSFPQNSFIDGRAYWQGLQLDEIAAPILLAWRLRREGALDRFDPCTMIAGAARYLMLQGPVTAQERWEEQSGYSPSTLATIIAGLVCAADFARESNAATADFLLAYADWLHAHLEDWLVTNRGELLPGKPRHFIRITPADKETPDAHPEVDTLEIDMANGVGRKRARNIVGGDFLHLVRLGLRDPHDLPIRDTLEVIDAVLRRDLPQGPCWRRYNHDAYGQKDDGHAYDGTGVGRSWPILTGERGHYELAAGRDPLPFITTLEKMANEGGMLSEQLWDADDLPGTKLTRGAPTGAAMPLCWSHAEYLSLVRSKRDGVCFDRIEPAHERYVRAPHPHSHEMWTLRHQTRRIPTGKTLRLVLPAPVTCRWTADVWATQTDAAAIESGLPGLWHMDLPTVELPAGSVIEWTFHWLEDDRWEGCNFRAEIV